MLLRDIVDIEATVLEGTQVTAAMDVCFYEQVTEVHAFTKSCDGKLDVCAKLCLCIGQDIGFTFHSNCFKSEFVADLFKLNFEMCSRSHTWTLG